ncbi:MAG: TSCPD domain-containing protein, partial [Candidatus Marinimicrobia bacterium]|nr:TSCPD domain-containing protein [Candidatus Neomarinimicrobiota bacterium]
ADLEDAIGASQPADSAEDPAQMNKPVRPTPEPAEAQAHQNPQTPRQALHPRRRQEITYGVTRRVRTGEGNLYITINEDDEGLCEVFTTIGKAGGMASTQAEAISRLISLALRSGVDPGEVVRQLKGISGPNPTWENGRLILSTPDAIGQALDDYLQKKLLSQPGSARPATGDTHPGGTILLTSIETSMSATDAPKQGTEPKFTTTCPDCGGPVVHESGCVTCPGCGYSRC